MLTLPVPFECCHHRHGEQGGSAMSPRRRSATSSGIPPRLPIDSGRVDHAGVPMARQLKVAVQMDPIESINIDADSTFALMLEAQRRGHTLWHYEVRHMALREGVKRQGERREERLLARVRPVTVERKRGAHYAFGDPAMIDLAIMDVVLMRQDPPFDMAYITATHLLEHIHPRTLVVNDPAAVRNAPEKLLVTHFPELMPPT